MYNLYILKYAILPDLVLITKDIFEWPFSATVYSCIKALIKGIG